MISTLQYKLMLNTGLFMIDVCLKWYCRTCGSYYDFVDGGFSLTMKLLNQVFLMVKLTDKTTDLPQITDTLCHTFDREFLLTSHWHTLSHLW